MEKEKIWKIYKHTNKINGKCYIGITSKKYAHMRWSKGKGYKDQVFYNAIKKYGWDNFEHEILKTCKTENEALEIEAYYILKYDSINNGYNIALSGSKSGTYGRHLSEETKKMIGDALS